MAALATARTHRRRHPLSAALAALRRLLLLAWASPYTALGLAFGVLVMACGGSVRRQDGCIEFSLKRSPSHCGRLLQRLPYRAITLGHVLVAVTSVEMNGLRAHEHVHVRQYEKWGALFGPAYLLSSVWQWVRGRRAYWDNPFEVEARRVSGN